MARLTKVQAWEKQSKFHEALRTPEFHRLTRAKQAEYLGVSDQTLYVWLNEIKDSEWDDVRDALDKKVAKDEIEIKEALTENAKGGDNKAIELWFEIKKGWSRKNINENINKNADLDGMTLEEKKREALKLYTLEELAKALAEKKAPGVVEWPENEYSQPKVEGGHGQP